MCKKVYYDYNVFLRWKEGKNADLVLASSQCRCKGYQLLYSPAHVEEIACIARDTKGERDADKFVNEHLNALSCFSKKLEIVPDPTSEKGVSFIEENPQKCWEDRVIPGYCMNYFFEEMNRIYKKQLSKNLIGKNQYKNILSELKIQKYICKNFAEIGYNVEDLSNINVQENRDYCLKFIPAMFKTLKEIGFKREGENKTRSEILDECHAIYAAQCDIFITEDKRLREKVKIIFRFLNIKTIILSISEWIEYMKKI